ncbi:tol-pal system protein YbgF [Thiomicrospira pelophila]|uniref:tol-pal system protein YbgF n=1 Tax=Thiomicrospira pelophila TaxID=934 RepID=UPI0004A7291F|nr:tol-pal system protein YbgF [Thiomicrospira pelophila]
MQISKQRITFSIVAFVGLSVFSSVGFSQTLEQRIERLERISSNPVLLQHSQRMNDQQREIQSLYDQVDRLVRQVQTLESKLDQSYEEMDERLNKLETRPKQTASPESTTQLDSAVVGSVKTEAAKSASTAVGSGSAQNTADAKADYDKAFGLLREGKYDESIQALSQFVKDFPNTSLTSNGYYWLGEAYLIKQEFAKAYAAFDTVIKQHVNSNKVEDAMLRGADSLVGLNRLEEAKQLYEQLVKQAPESRSAKSAVRRLERFNSGN